ncbi:hypothetical protein BH11CYA1_BH11CYA1_46420 [soil metagenome]
MVRVVIYVCGIFAVGIWSLIAISSPAQSTEERFKYYDEESIAEGSDQLMPGYILGEIELENLDKADYPLAHFIVSYDPIEGTAHLHVDLRFDNQGVITSYRVRGIGVRNPQWISE